MMLRTKMILSLLLMFTGITASFAQTFVANDDPIALALDSLATEKFLEKAWSKPVTPKNSKFYSNPDSIPVFDDFIYESRLAKLDAASPFDLVYNSTVRGYIDLYANRKRGQVSKMIALSQMYYPMFEEVLDKYNIPLELKHLAVIESALNPIARSRAGAMGLWQFMYPTGKLYGLEVNSYIDERNDPYKETVAAAEYLQFLYKMFGDWQMVLAAYNGGPGTVNHAIRRSGGKKTYWEIRQYLPKETQGYVPAFIAANYVMNYYSEHNIYPAVPKKHYFELDTVIIKEPLTFDQISSVLEVPVEDIEYYNPIYKKNVIPSGGYVLTLPKAKIGKFVSNEQQIYDLLRQQNEQQSLASATMKEKQITHVVHKNEKLATIAKKYGVSVTDIRNWNFIGRKGLKPGRKLVLYIKDTQPSTNPTVVPLENTSAAPQTNVAAKENKPVEKKKLAETKTSTSSGYYTVKSGDSLYKISQKTGVSMQELKKVNGLTDKSKLQIGQKLKLKQAA
jgi:membrane-bound lytic murein transglycosylase D